MQFDTLQEALAAASENVDKTRARWLESVRAAADPADIEVAEKLMGDPNLTSSDIDVSNLVRLGFVVEKPGGSLLALFPGWNLH